MKTKNVKENSNPTALLPHQFERTKGKKERKEQRKLRKPLLLSSPMKESQKQEHQIKVEPKLQVYHLS